MSDKALDMAMRIDEELEKDNAYIEPLVALCRLALAADGYVETCDILENIYESRPGKTPYEWNELHKDAFLKNQAAYKTLVARIDALRSAGVLERKE